MTVTVPPSTGLPTTWYVAEGYTGEGFDEYLTIQNPNSVTAVVSITYYLTGQSPVIKSVSIPAFARYTVVVHDAAEGVGRGQAVSAKIQSTNGVGVMVERPMYFTYTGRMGTVQGGHNVMAVASPRQRWYFAEGYTGPGFDEYLTILNPNTTAAPVTITYFLGSGGPIVKTITVPAQQRYTVTVHDTREGVGPDQAVSALVETTNAGGIVVERPMYFLYGGTVPEGHNVMGAPAPQPVWYFADGSTAGGNETYLTIMNPNTSPSQVRVTYFVVGEATPRSYNVTVPATSRYTISVHQVGEGVGPAQTLGVKVETVNGVNLVVERPRYSSVGGTNVMGASASRADWYFSEGYTGPGFQEDLVILNPNPTSASVIIVYYLSDGSIQLRTLVVAGNGRGSVNVNSPVTGVGAGRAVSARVVTDHPGGVVAERDMIFTYGSSNIRGSHAALGFTP